ncbi:MAG: hypothetical protein AAGE65_07560 [Planctomycetota bacterium]
MPPLPRPLAARVVGVHHHHGLAWLREAFADRAADPAGPAHDKVIRQRGDVAFHTDTPIQAFAHGQLHHLAERVRTGTDPRQKQKQGEHFALAVHAVVLVAHGRDRDQREVQRVPRAPVFFEIHNPTVPIATTDTKASTAQATFLRCCSNSAASL